MQESLEYFCEILNFESVTNSKFPPLSLSRILAKIEGESNFGRQHQSIDPFSLIKAADLQFPIIPKFMFSAGFIRSILVCFILQLKWKFKYVKNYPISIPLTSSKYCDN